MGSKVILLRFTPPLVTKTEAVIRELVYVDEGKGERAIDKIKKMIEKKYDDKHFVKGGFCLSSAETVWEEGVTTK